MFWENFKNLCESKGETPNGVCKALKFSNATATHWKNGKSPNARSLQAIADYFGVTVDYLLGKEPEQSQSVLCLPDPSPIQTAYDKASPEIQAAVRKLLDL